MLAEFADAQRRGILTHHMRHAANPTAQSKMRLMHRAVGVSPYIDNAQLPASGMKVVAEVEMNILVVDNFVRWLKSFVISPGNGL